MNKIKRFIMLVFLPALFVLNIQLVHAIPVFDPNLSAIAGAIQGTQAAELLQKIVYWYQMTTNTISSLMQAIQQVKYDYQLAKMAQENAAKITDVKSWDDLMNWYNNQAALEEATEDTFRDLNVSVGGKTFSVDDMLDNGVGTTLSSMGSAVTSTYDPNKNFTPEEQEAIWENAGISPQAYAYTQTWNKRDNDLLKKIQAKPETIAAQNDAAQKADAKTLQKVTTGQEDQNALLQTGDASLASVNSNLRGIRQDNADYYAEQEARQQKKDAEKLPPLDKESADVVNGNDAAYYNGTTVSNTSTSVVSTSTGGTSTASSGSTNSIDQQIANSSGSISGSQTSNNSAQDEMDSAFNSPNYATDKAQADANTAAAEEAWANTPSSSSDGTTNSDYDSSGSTDSFDQSENLNAAAQANAAAMKTDLQNNPQDYRPATTDEVNALNIVQRYNEGDPSITEDQYQAAQKIAPQVYVDGYVKIK